MRLNVFVAVLMGVLGPGALLGQQPPPDQRRLETGARLYGQHCTTCHGPGGDAAPGVNLKTGQFKRVRTDLEIMDTVLKGVPGTAMPATQMASADLVALVSYIRAMKDYGARRVAVGNAANGKTVVEGKGGCLKCHRVGTTGSYTGPDLTEVGASLPAATIEDTLLDPDAAAQPGHRTIRAVTKRGEVITGRRLNEDTWSVQIMDSRERLVSLWKPDLKEYQILESPMPSYRDTLTADERADVVAYLLSLQPARGRGGRGAQ